MGFGNLQEKFEKKLFPIISHSKLCCCNNAKAINSKQQKINNKFWILNLAIHPHPPCTNPVPPMGVYEVSGLLRNTKGILFSIIDFTHIIVTYKTFHRSIEPFSSLLPHADKQSSSIQDNFNINIFETFCCPCLLASDCIIKQVFTCSWNDFGS